MVNLKEENSSNCLENDKASKNILKDQNELYWKWRAIQREQLGISANLYMIFATTILGFLINFLIERKDVLECIVIVILTIATWFLIFSLSFYGWFTHNRLYDYRKTARYYKQRKTEEEVSELTKDIGKLTWNLYNIQKGFLFLGFVFSVIGLSAFIYF